MCSVWGNTKTLGGRQLSSVPSRTEERCDAVAIRLITTELGLLHESHLSSNPFHVHPSRLVSSYLVTRFTFDTPLLTYRPAYELS